LGLDDVLSDLDNIGYTTQPIVLPACAVGALHRRDRVFVLANANSEYGQRGVEQEIQRQQTLQGELHPRGVEEWARRSTIYEPKLLRNYHGFPDGVDRLKSLGNAVVPEQIYPILAAIKQIDDMLH
jgi:DNA (cytosine-5)-methyltransferase 1